MNESLADDALALGELGQELAQPVRELGNGQAADLVDALVMDANGSRDWIESGPLALGAFERGLLVFVIGRGRFKKAVFLAGLVFFEVGREEARACAAGAPSQPRVVGEEAWFGLGQAGVTTGAASLGGEKPGLRGRLDSQRGAGISKRGQDSEGSLAQVQ